MSLTSLHRGLAAKMGFVKEFGYDFLIVNPFHGQCESYFSFNILDLFSFLQTISHLHLIS